MAGSSSVSDRATIDAGARAAIPILSVTGVSKTFVGRRVLSDFTLEILPGEIRALLGQNGSGKLTFIKILAGYQPPDRGAHVTVGGVALELPLRPSEPRWWSLPTRSAAGGSSSAMKAAIRRPSCHSAVWL
jgi:ABC-type molybdenum transport system ATPase subunit/photorepair protein PhrA